MKTVKGAFASYKRLLNAAYLHNITILFLLFTPLAVIQYALFIYNPTNSANPILWIVHIIADTISLTVMLGLWLTILTDVLVPEHHKLHAVPDSLFLKKKKKVDVLVTVAGENIEIIRQTITAVSQQSYPVTIYILDDGKSEEVKSLASEFSAVYVSREKSDFAKAGNVNNGLTHSKGEFFVILDADQKPKQDFVEKILPYFSEEGVAMVQTPQVFTNTSNFIASGTAQAQTIFYKYVCPAKNVSNSVFCVGTNVMFRRSAIDQIGGIKQINHSEDIWTSYHLHEKKWKTVFVNSELVTGLAPETVVSYFKQQLRWAKGGLGMMFYDNPLANDALTIDQRLQYFYSNFFFLIGFSILIYLLSPILYLLFGLQAFSAPSVEVWLIHYLPYFLLYIVVTWLLLGRVRVATMATSVALFYPLILAFLSTVFGTEQEWVATTSRKSSSDLYLKWTWPHITIFLVSGISLFFGWINGRNVWVTLYYSLWVVLHMYLLYTFLTAQFRNEENKL